MVAGTWVDTEHVGASFVRPSFAYGKGACSHCLAVERFNGRPGTFGRGHGHEAETARLMIDSINRYITSATLP